MRNHSTKKHSNFNRKEVWMRVKDPAELRRKRKQQRFSQAELAFLVRRSQTTIHLLETGGMKTLTEDLAVSIAGRLKVDWEDLFLLQEHEVAPTVASDVHSTAQGGRPKARLVSV